MFSWSLSAFDGGWGTYTGWKGLISKQRRMCVAVPQDRFNRKEEWGYPTWGVWLEEGRGGGLNTVSWHAMNESVENYKSCRKGNNGRQYGGAGQ